LRLKRSARGQALTETMLTMSLVILIVFGFVQLCLLEATKSMVSLAAFSAARAVMVLGRESAPLDNEPDPAASSEFADLPKVQTGWAAAWQVLDGLRWWRESSRNRPDFPLGIARRNARLGLTVTYTVPFGPPVFNASPDGLRVTAFSPYIIQHQAGAPDQDVQDHGDNAQR
jgi:TadE-like protein